MSTAASFDAGAIRRGQGVVDHRMARRHLINEVKRKRIAASSVCDAHPELIRAARNVGTVASIPCPICSTADSLRLVTYVFGSRLPASGKVVSTSAELSKLDGRADELTAYVVEACVECRWHHLVRAVPVGGRRVRRTG